MLETSAMLWFTSGVLEKVVGFFVVGCGEGDCIRFLKRGVKEKRSGGNKDFKKGDHIE